MSHREVTMRCFSCEKTVTYEHFGDTYITVHRCTTCRDHMTVLADELIEEPRVRFAQDAEGL